MLVEKGRFSVVEETKSNVAPTASVAESMKHRSDVCLSVCRNSSDTSVDRQPKASVCFGAVRGLTQLQADGGIAQWCMALYILLRMHALYINTRTMVYRRND